MAERKGFEPLQGLHLLAVFETAPFNHLGTSPAVVIISFFVCYIIFSCIFVKNIILFRLIYSIRIGYEKKVFVSDIDHISIGSL